MTGVQGIELQFEATELGVRKALIQLREALFALNLPEDDASRAEIVLAEALNNVAEHAYDRAVPGDVRVGLSLSPGLIGIVIRDTGRPVPAHLLQGGCMPALDCGLDDLPEGGFGWPLIRTLTESLVYRRTSGTNELRMDLARQGGAPRRRAP